MRRALLGLAVLALSCGPRNPAPFTYGSGAGTGSGSGSGGGPGSGGDAIVVPPLPATCPATYAELTGACDATAQRETCAYAEGSCYCGETPICSGVDMSHEPRRPVITTWQCTPTPPLVRPDGCPGRAIGGGEACGREGQSCSYGDCCFHTFTCQGGTWQLTGGGCPP